MPAPAHTIRYSYAEYVAFERSSNVKHETLIVEVLSRSTEQYDRGEKFEHYKSVPSLRQYVLVSHRDPRHRSLDA